MSSNKGVDRLLLNDAIFKRLLTIVDWYAGRFEVEVGGVDGGRKVEVEAS